MVFNGQLYTLEEDRISNNFIYRGLLQCRMTLMCKVSGCQIPTAGQKQCQLFNCHLWDLKKWDGTAYVLPTEQFRKLVHEVGLLSNKSSPLLYMLGAKHGFGQSPDVTAQSVDPCFARTIPGMFHLQRSACWRSKRWFRQQLQQDLCHY